MPFSSSVGNDHQRHGASSPHEQTPLVGDSSAPMLLSPLFEAAAAPASASHSSAFAPPLSPLHAAPRWQFWQTTSAWHRFFLLVLMCCIPFGGHFVKNGMSSIEPLMLENPEFPLTNTMYGALISAVSVPNMFIPLFGGRFLDKSGHHSIQFFLVWICIGQAIFAIGMQLHLFWLALFGRVFFGVGEGSVVVGARVFVAYWFRNKELTFAMGVMVAITNVSKMLAKVTVAPVSLLFGDYVYALWYGVVICILSALVGVACYRYTARLQHLVDERVHDNEPLEGELQWLEGYAADKRRRHNRRVRKLSLSQASIGSAAVSEQVSCDSVQDFSSMFWTVAILHVIFVTVFHLFQNVSSSFFKERYGYSVVNAGFVSSMSHSFVIFAPFMGLIVDHFGGRVYWIIVSSVLSVMAYALMIFTEVTPLVSMVLISICLSFTPTILMSAIPTSVSPRNYGAAFGIVEVTDAVGATFGNLMIGYLRDETGSYTLDMYVLLGMAVMTFVLSLVLIGQDQKSGGLLSAPTSRARAVSMDDDTPMDHMLLQFSEDLAGSDRATEANRRAPTSAPPVLGGFQSRGISPPAPLSYQSTATPVAGDNIA